MSENNGLPFEKQAKQLAVSNIIMGNIVQLQSVLVEKGEEQKKKLADIVQNGYKAYEDLDSKFKGTAIRQLLKDNYGYESLCTLLQQISNNLTSFSDTADLKAVAVKLKSMRDASPSEKQPTDLERAHAQIILFRLLMYLSNDSRNNEIIKAVLQKK